MPHHSAKVAETDSLHWVIAVLIALPLGAFLVWHLHNAQPNTMTNVVINRNTLLPHRFAGVCMNCHQILEVGPTEINRNNMHLLNLSAEQRRLIASGQSVQVPSLMEKLRIPAVVRADVLPHAFVGVCSNCHPVLDIPPSPGFMRRAMTLATQNLDAFDLRNREIARATAPRDQQNDRLRDIWGVVALVLFVLSSVYVFMRILMRADPDKYKKQFNLKQWFKIHEWTSIAFCFATIAHWHYSDEGNNFLHISLALVIWLTLGGLVLRYRWAKGEAKKNVRLAHTQLVIFFINIALLAVGHYAAVVAP